MSLDYNQEQLAFGFRLVTPLEYSLTLGLLDWMAKKSGCSNSSEAILPALQRPINNANRR